MTPDRRPYLAANWKMHKTNVEARSYVEELAGLLGSDRTIDVCLCVPFTSLEAAAEAAKPTPITIAAQNMHQDPEGAYTGEVSAPMLVELGVNAVVLGHSERREHFCETDRALKDKLPAALEAGLAPILCVGETEDEREADETERKLRHQVQEDLERVPDDQLAEVVVAYEPIWAIGTGRVATPEQAQEAIAFIRALVGDRSEKAAAATRVIYGGSVDPENAPEILSQPDVDGALVGGASLEPNSFHAIVATAAAG
jgi:triosephosphate isomerase